MCQCCNNELTILSLSLFPAPLLLDFHEFVFNKPDLLTDLISSVSQPPFSSHTAAAAGNRRGGWVSLDVIQKHTHTTITTPARTLYRFLLIPWKITRSSNSEPVCAELGSNNKLSLSFCVCLIRKVCSQESALISFVCTEAQSTLSYWGDLTRLTSQL